MKQLLLTILISFFLTECYAQTDSLSYKFLDWYVTTLGLKKIYIDKIPNNISKYDLGTQKDYFQWTDTNTHYPSGEPVTYSQKIINAFYELKINYDTASLNLQIINSKGSFLTQDKFKNGKVVSCRLLSPLNNFPILSILFRPFKHKRTIFLSIPLWTDSNKYVVVKSSVLNRLPREIQSSIDIFQLQTDNSFKLIKRIERE